MSAQTDFSDAPTRNPALDDAPAAREPRYSLSEQWKLGMLAAPATLDVTIDEIDIERPLPPMPAVHPGDKVLYQMETYEAETFGCSTEKLLSATVRSVMDDDVLSLDVAFEFLHRGQQRQIVIARESCYGNDQGCWRK